MTHLLAATYDPAGLSLAGEVDYTADDARAALAGYAFATRTFPTRAVWGRPAGQGTARRWGYRAYDCVPVGDGEEFSELDLLVPAGLNADLDVAVLESLRWAATAAAAPLGRAVRAAARLGVSFWDLDFDEVGSNPPSGSIGDDLNRAWAACMSAPDLKVTRVHKLLHHKAPHLVPLIDRRTRPALRRAAARWESDGLWQVIHRDLQQPAFAELETWFEQLATPRGGIRLTRLRIHDILLWLDATGQRTAAIRHGQDLDTTVPQP